jgi:hypothetical protein
MTDTAPEHLQDMLASYQRAWQANSAAAIENHWDTHQPPLYKAEEIQTFFTSWEDLRAYWRHNEAFNSANELSWREFRVQAVTPDVQLLGMRMRWDIRFASGARNMDGSGFAWAGQAMGGENHVVACLKKVGAAWRFVSWVEAPDAPILYMAELYRRNVRPDFRGR